MTIPVLLIGATIAMCIFAALGWSVVRAVQTQGRLRTLHGLHAVGIVAAMACISFHLVALSQILGGVLMAVALTLGWRESGSSRLFALFGLAFSLALVTGLPFA